MSIYRKIKSEKNGGKRERKERWGMHSVCNLLLGQIYFLAPSVNTLLGWLVLLQCIIMTMGEGCFSLVFYCNQDYENYIRFYKPSN
ncbi:hypothetical protein BDV28DRAFT_119021 [Aspergillus coremiiformis]|uniref:Uncharacterized protein n=1 Tax=Aspergillus coremiiformis TaxID=138285 RepID=A0A5N6Z5D9_9EURO|nr:hypothetical protein BDV28DRAFT_119021 [Aspergillus coremiiformis]